MHELLSGIWQALKPAADMGVCVVFIVFLLFIALKDGVVSIYKMLIMPIVTCQSKRCI